MSKSTNVILWMLQILLAFYMVTGGMYMMSNYRALASSWALGTLPSFAWTVIGVLQILFALGLVLPGLLKKSHTFTAQSAVGLVVISLLGAVLYSAYAGSGILWAVLPAAVAAFIAYMRR